MLELEVQRASTSKGQPQDEAFQRWAEAALTGQREDAELSIRIVDNDEMQALNRQYRDQDKPTNVLSFEAELPDIIESSLLGDIVICAPVVEQEAEQQAKQSKDHWAHMTVHGVLHLLGYDHIEEAEAQEMEQLERDILARLGVADPYGVEGRL